MGLNAWAFYYKFNEYNSGTGFDLMGYPLPIAKGCADMMKVHNLLISTAYSCFVSLSIFRFASLREGCFRELPGVAV